MMLRVRAAAAADEDAPPLLLHMMPDAAIRYIC